MSVLTIPVIRNSTTTQQALLRFSSAVIATSLLLQRFGLPAGDKAINLVGPVGLLLAFVQLCRGRLVFSPIRLGFYLIMLAYAAVALAYNFTIPPPFAVGPSLPSTAQFFIMTSFATLSFAEPVPESLFVRIVTKWLAVVATAGMLQFVAQFAGFGLFSFRGIVPDWLLFEDGYNLTISFGVGALIKSNGFFLLEPSIFSQFMAIGIIVEVLTLRRPIYLALFAMALLLSGAGTGWLVLGTFVASAAFSLGVRGVILAVLTLGIGGGLLAGVTLLAPDVASALSDRLNEISRPGTSGHLRFITPFWLLSDVTARAPTVGLLGLGGGVSDRLNMPYELSMNTPVKITLDYGFPAFLAYIGTILLGAKSATQRALCMPALMQLMFTGGYQQFPPVLYFLLLLITISRVTSTPKFSRPCR